MWLEAQLDSASPHFWQFKGFSEIYRTHYITLQRMCCMKHFKRIMATFTNVQGAGNLALHRRPQLYSNTTSSLVLSPSYKIPISTGPKTLRGLHQVIDIDVKVIVKLDEVH